MTKVYQQAFTEVYEILNYLDEDNYNKIPKNIINALEKNRDTEYEFFVDESIPFYEQDVLEETKAILFNLYRDYLASSKIKDKIIQYQKEEFYKLEKIKKDKYGYENLFHRESIKKIEKNDSINEVSMIEHKNSILNKILKNIKILLRKIKKH